MYNQEHHSMTHVGTGGTYHEFQCNVCGRHVLFHVNPAQAADDERTVVILRSGDMHASHSGGIGSITVSGVDVACDEVDWSGFTDNLDSIVEDILGDE